LSRPSGKQGVIEVTAADLKRVSMRGILRLREDDVFWLFWPVRPDVNQTRLRIKVEGLLPTLEGGTCFVWGTGVSSFSIVRFFRLDNWGFLADVIAGLDTASPGGNQGERSPFD